MSFHRGTYDTKRRQARYDAKRCQHCANARDCKSARCSACRQKAAAYQQRRRDAA